MARRARPNIPKDIIEKALDDIDSGRKKQIEIARELGITRAAVSLWIQKRKDPERFKYEKQSERPIEPLPDDLREQVSVLLKEGAPSKYGLLIEGDQWVPVTVRDLIHSHLKRKDVSMPAVYEYLANTNGLPVHVASGQVEGYRRPGRPRKDQEFEVLSNRKIVRRPFKTEENSQQKESVPKAKPSPQVEIPKPSEIDDTVEMADMSYYEAAVKETREEMAAKASTLKPLHGVRTGKRAKAGKRKKKRRK